MSAFEHYLLSVPREEAAAHLAQCLFARGELAWDLLARLHGEDWSVEPFGLGALLLETIDKLKKEQTP